MAVDYSLYSCAEITLIWSYNRLEKQHVNIFSVVEFIPSEQELSCEIRTVENGNVVPMKRIQISSTISIYATRLCVGIEEALSFFGKESTTYRNIKINEDILQIESLGNLTVEPNDGQFILVSPNVYPKTSIEHVLPRRSMSCRVCARFDTGAITLKLFSNSEFLKVAGFVNDVLGINLISFSEFVGAIILSCPNPYMRHFEGHLSRDRQKFIYEIFERKGQSIIGGEIEILEERPSGHGFVIRKVLDQNKGIINIPYAPYELRTRIFSKERELLEDVSGHFIQNVNINIGVVGSKRVIHMIDQNDGTEKIHNIDVITDEVHSMAGDILETKTPIMVLNESEKYRIMDALKSQREFIYFPSKSGGASEEARQIIREIICKASERCIIVDPYLSGDDVVKFGLFVSNSKVVVRLLSSAAFLMQIYQANGKKILILNKVNSSTDFAEFDKKESIDCSVSSEQSNLNQEEVSYGEIFLNRIQELSAIDKSLQLKCHVLKGRKKSPVHDRFIIVDNDAYILGSSLNEFGSRATTLFKVPDPRIIIGEVEKWWNDAKISTELEQWIKEKQQGATDVGE